MERAGREAEKRTGETDFGTISSSNNNKYLQMRENRVQSRVRLMQTREGNAMQEMRRWGGGERMALGWAGW